MTLVLAMSDFLDPSRGPDQSGSFQVSPTFFLVLLGVGAVVAVIGHIVRSRTLQATGILLVMLATVLLPLALAITR